jgi:RNA polymerase sigma-70 factor (sigma-E family)
MDAAAEAEFRSFAASRMRDLRRTAYLLCGDWHHADDATQAVLTKLYTNWNKIQELERVDAYVHTMLVRATFERRRKFWWRREISSAQPPETTTTDDAQVDERMVLVDALAKMPPRQRAAVVLRYWQDLDIAETARALGCSEGTVKSQCARGLATLRALLTDSHLMEGRSS